MPVGLHCLAALCLLALSIGCMAPRAAQAQQQSHVDQAFYEVEPAAVPGRPGSLIRYQPLPLPEIYRAKAYRIIYRSRDIHDRPIAVSGMVIVSTYGAPGGVRPVIAWAHGTTGIAPKCAPSRHTSPLEEIPGIADMIADGYAVVATDYPGLGVPGPAPYMVGLSEGRAVLDSVRAMRELPFSDFGDRFALWGHSQGGHAVLFATQLAASYAPELRLVGVAAAAPATELGPLFSRDDNTDDGRILAAYALKAWSLVYNVNLETLVEPQALPAVRAIDKDCVDSIGGGLKALSAQQALARGFLIADPQTIEPWRTLLATNTPGHGISGHDVFISQGQGDTIVRPGITRQFIGTLCRQHNRVTVFWMPTTDHGLAARHSASQAVHWISERFGGRPVRNDCGAQ